jgi:hypothetical protein|tara:strand:+ start:161 stop:805 length:645 start_codon:yes stop_codon:yes gene_type:complete
MKTSESIKEFATAFGLAQAEMGGVVKNKQNGGFKGADGKASLYADLAAVIEVVKQPFCNHGLCFMQFPISNTDGMGVVTRIMHTSGEWIESEFTMPLGKVTVHGSGSNFSYARRYALSSACGIPQTDDDGNAASLSVEPFVGLSDVQYASLTQMLEQTEFDVARFLHAYKIKQVNQLPSIDFEEAMERVKVFGQKKAEAALEEKASAKKEKVQV